MSRSVHRFCRYAGEKLFNAELAARKARLEREEAAAEAVDFEQRRREFAEAHMLYWAGRDEAKVAHYAGRLVDAGFALHSEGSR